MERKKKSLNNYAWLVLKNLWNPHYRYQSSGCSPFSIFNSQVDALTLLIQNFVDEFIFSLLEIAIAYKFRMVEQMLTINIIF